MKPCQTTAALGGGSFTQISSSLVKRGTRRIGDVINKGAFNPCCYQ